MIGMFRWLFGVCFFLSMLQISGAAFAQNQPENALETPPSERIDIGLSKETVEITTDFSGLELIIFGAVDNLDPFIQRQGRYDIFLILEGPKLDFVARRKERIFGIWMNTRTQAFDNSPQSYLIASTRFARDVTGQETIERLGLDVPFIRLWPKENENNNQQTDIFKDAVREIKTQTNLFKKFPGNVEFLSRTLFRAELELPSNVPLGNHRAVAYLFRNGELVGQTQAPLRIAKAGYDYQIYKFSRNSGLVYGILCVVVALIIGWTGRVVFKKD